MRLPLCRSTVPVSKILELIDSISKTIYILISQYTEDHIVKQLIKVMKALSDPSRVKIVKMLQHRVMCVCEIQAALDLAQPTVSKHLRVLEDAGLLSHEKEGLWVNYRLTDGRNSPYAASLLGNLKHWLDDDLEIVHLVEILPSIKREEVCKK